MRKLPVPDLGHYLREQRELAQLSLRQAAKAAGISNPYLSQIERGLRRPSAEILQQLAKGLSISAEQLYVQAGILDESAADERAESRAHDVQAHDQSAPEVHGVNTQGVVDAVQADPQLTDRQRAVLLDVYHSFVGGSDAADETTDIPDTVTR